MITRTYIDTIADALIFTDEILDQIRYNYNKEEVKKIFEKRLNEKLTIYTKESNSFDTKINVSQIIRDEENVLIKEYHATYCRLISNRYEFVIKTDNRYTFDISNISNKCSINDFTCALEDIAGSLFQEKIIEVINKVNYIEFLKTLNFKKSFTFLSKKSKIILTKYHNAYSYYLLLFSIIFFILLIFKITDKRIEISSTSQQTIALTIIGSLTSFLGFSVVIFQLSFDNLKKIYGSYSKVILFRSLGNELFVTFTVVIISAIFAAIFEKENYKIAYVNIEYYLIQNITFNISVTLYIVFIIKLGIKLKSTFSYSVSSKNLNKIISSINLKSIQDLKPNFSSEYDTLSILESYEVNFVEILSEITTNLILQNNHKLSEVIIIELTNHLKETIESITSNINYESDSQDVVFAYVRTMRKVVDTTYKTPFRDLINTCYSSMITLNYITAIYKSNINTYLQVINLIDSSIISSIQNNAKEDFLKGLSCYKNCILNHILYNTPCAYESESSSIHLITSRRETYHKNSSHLNTIIHGTEHFYKLTLTCINNYDDIGDSNLLGLISNYRDLLNSVILQRSDVYTIRYRLIERLTYFTSKLYEEAFKKKMFNKNVFVDNPFDAGIIDRLVKHDNHIHSILSNAYKSWCSFIMNENKTKRYVSNCIETSIWLFESQIKFISQEANGIQNNKYSKNYRFISYLIDMYDSLNYVSNNYEKETVSEINSRFWQFRQFNEVVQLPDNIFYKKLDQIIMKTEWANRTTTKVPNLSLIKKVTTIFLRLLHR